MKKTRHSLSRLAAASSLILLLALLVGPALAASTFFDDFAGSSPGWTSSLGSGGSSSNVVNFNSSGTLLLANNGGVGGCCAPEFPLVGRNDAFNGITPYWRLSIRYRFPEVTAYGVSIAAGSGTFNTTRVPQGSPARADWGNVLSFHQLSGALYIDAFGNNHNGPAPDTNWHTADLEVANNLTYVLRLDGTQIGSGNTGGVIPQALWFGNYYTMAWWGNWTDIRVDWVRVETDLESPTTSATLSGTAGNAGWYRSAVQVLLSAGDAWSGVANTQYRIDGGGWQTYSGAFTISAEGTHTVEYRSTDNAGNVETVQSRIVRIDTVAPSTTATTSCTAPGSGGWCQGPVDLSLSASDATSGVDSTEYRVDGGAWQAYVPGATITGDGIHTIGYRSVDVAGNVENTDSVQVRIDATPPATTMNLNGTSGNAGWYRSAVQVSLSSGDATSGVANTQYRIDGGAWQSYSLPFTVSGEGSHAVEYRSTDVAGNTETVQSRTVRIDTVAPGTTTSTSCTAPGSGGWCQGPVDLSLSASDATSGVDSTEYRVDGGAWQAYSAGDQVTGDGTHTVEYRSTDVAGNVEAIDSLTIQIDGTPPASTISLNGTSGNAGWYVSSVQITLSAADATSGVDDTEYRIDGGSWQTYSGAFTISAEGTHTVAYRSTDVAGNVETTHNQAVRVDTVAPGSSFTSLSDDEWINNTVTIAGTASDPTPGSGLDSVDISRNGGGAWLPAGGTANWSTAWDTTAGADGDYDLGSRAEDVAGNQENPGFITVHVDNTPPATTIAFNGTMGNAGWYVSPVDVSLSANDGSGIGVDVIEYRLDGGAWQPYGTLFTVSGEGSHTIEYRSKDLLGNVESIGSRSLQIDTVAPSTTAAPSGTVGNAGWYVSSVQISLSAADATSGVDDTEYRIDGGSWQTYSEPFTILWMSCPACLDGASFIGGGWQTYGGPFTIASEGVHQIEYRSTDVAGNVEMLRTLTVRVDTVPPSTEGHLYGTAGNAGWWRSSVYLTLIPTDETSGVDATQVQVDGEGWQDYTSPRLITGQGDHQARYYSIDVAGNEEIAQNRQIRIDSIPPRTTATITGEQGDNDWYTATVTVTLTAIDATSGVGDTFLNHQTITFTTYTQDGRYSAPYWSTDVAGNEEPHRSATFNLDTTLPQAYVVGGAFCPGCGEVILLQVTATDETSGLAAWELQIFDGSTVIRSWSGTSSPGAVSWNGTHVNGRRVAAGTYDLLLRTRDNAGWRNSGTGQVRITTSPPSPPTATPCPPVTSTPWPTPTPSATLTQVPLTPSATPTLRPGETPSPTPRRTATPRPTSTPVPVLTSTPIPVAEVPEPDPGIALRVMVFQDDDVDAVRAPVEAGLEGLWVRIEGASGWKADYMTDPQGVVTFTLPGPDTYNVYVAQRPGHNWQPTSRPVIELRVDGTGSLVILPASGRKVLPVGVADGVTFAFGVVARRLALCVPLTSIGLLFVLAATAVSDPRPCALQMLKESLLTDLRDDV